MPGAARRISAAFVINNEVYVGCGTNSNSPVSTFLNDFYKYNPTTNSWSYQISNASFTPKIDPEFIAIGDSAVYSISGYSSDQSLSEVWQLKLDFDTCDYYDTTFVQDTTFVTDTTFINDTTFATIYDTSYIQIEDTLIVYKLDTIEVYVIDTFYRTIFDTTYVTTYDTVTTMIYDTVTIYTYDTITRYVNIAVEDTLNFSIYTDNCFNITHKLYPNPSSDMVYLFSNNADCLTGYRLEFIDAIGQILETKPYATLVSFDVRSYARALYFVRLIGKDGDTLFSKKVVIR